MRGSEVEAGYETPGGIPDLYARRFNQGDLGGLLELCDPDIAIVPESGANPRHGIDAAREMLSTYLAIKLTLKFEDRVVIEADDIALVLSHWTMQGTTPEGSFMDLSGTASDVLRRGPDGHWRVLIDNPWGTA